MTVDLQTNVVFVTADEAPPAEVVRLVEHPRGIAEGRELDSFLAELDAGQNVPGLLVAVGGTKVIEVLRRHERTACLPIFCWGSGARVAPGWDGNVVSWKESQLAQAAAWHKILASARPVSELGEQQRREHHFLRYLASRGAASLPCMEVFGIEFPDGAVLRWQRNDWITMVGTDILQVTPALMKMICGSNHEVAPLLAADSRSQLASETQPEPPQDSATLHADVATVHADVVASLLQESSARQRSMPTSHPVVATQRGFGLRDVLLLALLGFVGFDLWQRYVQAYFFAPQIMVEQALARTPADPNLLLELSQQVAQPLVLDAHLSWEIENYKAAFDGRIQWRLGDSSVVQEGDILGYLVQGAAVEGVDRDAIQRQLDALYEQIADQQNKANEAAASAILSARAARSEVVLQQQAFRQRLANAQLNYDRARQLAEDGVLSYREIRQDWEAVQAAKEELADAGVRLEQKQRELDHALAYEIPSISEDPVWQAQTNSLRQQREAAPKSDLGIPIIAADRGLFVVRVPNNGPCASGEVLGQLRKSAAGHVEAVLATADWDPIYLQGAARLRRPERSSWMPTRILAAESLPTGMTLLRLRWPVEWLDGSNGVSVDNATQLELRVSAPLSAVHESK